MIKSSKKEHTRSSSPASSGNLLSRPRAQNDKKTRDTGPLPPLREQVGKRESVQTFIQSRVMGGCELIDTSCAINSNKPADGACRGRIDVDLALIGLEPEQLWSRLLLIKPDLQVTSSKDQTVNPPTLIPNTRVPLIKEQQVHDNNDWQQGKDFYSNCRPHQDEHDLFSVGYSLVNNVSPTDNDIRSSNAGSDLPADSPSLEYFDLDTFQAEIGLTQHQQVMGNVNTNVVAASTVQLEVQHQTRIRKRKQDKASVERNITCSQCPRKFKSAGHLKIHSNSAHPTDGTVSKCHCDICGKGFSHKGALALHKRRHRARPLATDSG